MSKNMRITLAFLMTGVCVAGLCTASTQTAGSADSHVVPLKKPATLAMDKRIEAIRGDRYKPGEPFVIRIHAEAGYIIMPHTHPVDENIVVVRGSWALGMGEHFRKEALEPMEVGDYGFAAKSMPHFAFSKTYTILQVHGIGPFTVHWVTPVYELTERGVLRKETAEDPGTLVPTAPPDCFALQLGAHARGSYGEGAIVGAQCTPGELTQYRVAKQDGERFWSQRADLRPF
jgi:hypothetical protein